MKNSDKNVQMQRSSYDDTWAGACLPEANAVADSLGWITYESISRYERLHDHLRTVGCLGALIDHCEYASCVGTSS